MVTLANVALVAGCGALGWLLGYPLGLAARRLEAGPDGPPTPRLVVDPLLQGFQALTLVALSWRFGLSTQLAVFGALSLFLTLVLFVDLRARFVYGVIAYPGIVAGVVLTPLVQHAAPWEGLVSAALGAAVFGLLYLLGRVLYRGGEPLATGDVTIGALVGSIVGIGQLIPAVFFGVCLSGLFAVALAVHRRSLHAYLPYGPGLCLGALIALLR
jgi:prepilin signal peptidase PulO-like enzyme (type II secretory pathway)